MSESKLQSRTVFLSASVPNRPPWPEARSRPSGALIRSAVISITKRTVYEGGSLVFGGHPSISPFILSVAEDYLAAADEGPEVGQSIFIYQSKAVPAALRPEATAKLVALGGRLVDTDAQNDEKFDPDLTQEQCIESLRHMRERMLKETDPVGMIVIGGMEGILRECLVFRRMFPKRPIWVLESTGGMAHQLLQPRMPHVLDFYANVRAEPRELEATPAERILLDGVDVGDEYPYVLLAERIAAKLASS
jgi:hypothetical protein